MPSNGSDTLGDRNRSTGGKVIFGHIRAPITWSVQTRSGLNSEGSGKSPPTCFPRNCNPVGEVVQELWRPENGEKIQKFVEKNNFLQRLSAFQTGSSPMRWKNALSHQAILYRKHEIGSRNGFSSAHGDVSKTVKNRKNQKVQFSNADNSVSSNRK